MRDGWVMGRATVLGLSRAETICTCPKAQTRLVELFFQTTSDLTAPHRLDKLKQVIAKVHSGKYRWAWKKFGIAIAWNNIRDKGNQCRSLAESGRDGSAKSG